MTDFDFDEIDKAVNGAIGGDEPASSGVSPMPDESLAQAAPSTPPVSSTPTPSFVPPADRVSLSSSSTVPPRPADTTSSSMAPAARRSSGRFMDMVHPASAMRGRPGVSEPATSGQSLNPAESSPAEAAPSANQGFGSGMSNTSTDTSTDASADTSTETLQAGMESILAGDQQDTSAALETPFLPDAKVEKRPLGGSGFPDELTLEDLQPESEPEQELIEAPEALDKLESPAPEGLLDAPEAEASIQAPEETQLFQGVDPLNQLEPSEESYIEESLPEPTTSDSDMVSADQADAAAQQQEVAKEEVSAAPEVISASLAGPASITQQYAETPSSTQETGAIYDTESYHQAIPASSKKKSALWAIMWIVLLIIAGAGAGAAFYVYVLPML